jgi:hypothetical protein
MRWNTANTRRKRKAERSITLLIRLRRFVRSTEKAVRIWKHAAEAMRGASLDDAAGDREGSK